MTDTYRISYAPSECPGISQGLSQESRDLLALAEDASFKVKGYGNTTPFEKHRVIPNLPLTTVLLLYCRLPCGDYERRCGNSN